jgi:hypothetical protein
MKARQRVRNDRLQGDERCEPGPFSLGIDVFDARQLLAANVLTQYDALMRERNARPQPTY